MNTIDKVSPLTHSHSSWEKHRQEEWELVTGVCTGKNGEWLRGSWVVGAVLPEVVTSSLRFSDMKKTGSYKSKGEPWMLK